MAQDDVSGRRWQFIVLLSIFYALTTVAVALRIHVRAFLIKNFRADDSSAVLGWALFIMSSSFFLFSVAHGTGQHIRLIEPPENVPIAVKWLWAAELVYVLANMAIKMSVGLQLLRFIQDRPQRICIWILMGILEAFSMVGFLMIVFQCSPISLFWNRYQGAKAGSCVNVKTAVIGTYGYSAVICLVDWTFAIIPWFILRKLPVNKRTKIMAGLALSLGAIASIATIVRLPYTPLIANEADILYSTVDFMKWSFVECALSIIATAATTWKPLFKRYLNPTTPIPCHQNPGPRDPYAKQPRVMASEGSTTICELDDVLTTDGRYQYSASSDYLGQHEGGRKDQEA